MNYDYFDFAVLFAIRENKRSIRDILFSACESLPCLPSRDLLCFSLSNLIKDNFIEVQNGDLILSGRGRELFSNRKKLFESKDAYIERLCGIFTQIELIPCENITCHFDGDEYVKAADELSNKYNATSPLSLLRVNEKLILSLKFSKKEERESELAEDEFELPSRLDFELSDKYALNFLSSLGKLSGTGIGTKKLCIPAVGASYVLSFCRAKQGIRITSQKILFNRQRFFGKSDGELDYAQCSDPLIDFCVSEKELCDSLALILSESRAINTERSVDL